jgi:hypothetical protein
MTTRHNERGTAMLAALILVMVLSLGATATWRHLHLVREQANRYEKQEVARQLAEAGLNKAIAMLRQDAMYRGEAHTPLGAGRFSVDVARGTAPGAFELEAVGEIVNDGLVAHTAQLAAYLRLSPGGHILEYAWRAETDEGWQSQASGGGGGGGEACGCEPVDSLLLARKLNFTEPQPQASPAPPPAPPACDWHPSCRTARFMEADGVLS